MHVHVHVHDMWVCVHECVCVHARCVVASAGMNAVYHTVPLCMMHVLLYRLGRAHSFEITKVHFCRIFAGDLSYGDGAADAGRAQIRYYSLRSLKLIAKLAYDP